MLAIAKIREDLVEVRYYYTRKKVFDEANESVGTNMILGKVKKYNEAMRTAPPLLYDLYREIIFHNFNHFCYCAIPQGWDLRKLGKRV